MIKYYSMIDILHLYRNHKIKLPLPVLLDITEFKKYNISSISGSRIPYNIINLNDTRAYTDNAGSFSMNIYPQFILPNYKEKKTISKLPIWF